MPSLPLLGYTPICTRLSTGVAVMTATPPMSRLGGCVSRCWTGATGKGMVEEIWALRGKGESPLVALAEPGARDDGQLQAIREVEATWHAWLTEYMGNHRCS